MHKIKVWFRRKYLFWKYKHNYGTGKVIITKESDRQLGLTTMMIEDCLNRNCRLFVSNEIAKEHIVRELHKRVNGSCFTTSINLYDYVISVHDIVMGKFRGQRNVKIIIDNQCKFKDVERVIDDTNYAIVNGFMYCGYAK